VPSSGRPSQLLTSCRTCGPVPWLRTVDLDTLVRQATEARLRPVAIECATDDEWDEFECGLLAERGHWLLSDPDQAEASDVTSEQDQAWMAWLRGRRGVLGSTYLTLAVHDGTETPSVRTR